VAPFQYGVEVRLGQHAEWSESDWDSGRGLAPSLTAKVVQPDERVLQNWAELAAWNAFKYDGWSPATSIAVQPDPTPESPEEQDLYSLCTEWVLGHAYRSEAAFCPIAPPAKLQDLKDTCSKDNVELCNELSEKWIGLLQAQAALHMSSYETEEKQEEYRQVIAMRIKVERSRSRELMDIRLHQLSVIEMHAKCFEQATQFDDAPPPLNEPTYHRHLHLEVVQPLGSDSEPERTTAADSAPTTGQPHTERPQERER